MLAKIRWFWRSNMMLITMLQSFIRICLYSKYVIYLESIDFQDSFQGLLRCYSGIVTVPGFFSGIITVPGLFSGIITLLFRDYYCTWILFRDCYCPPHLFWGLLLYSFSTLLLYSFSTLLLSSISGIIQATPHRVPSSTSLRNGQVHPGVPL
jgi:hypothetical protein